MTRESAAEAREIAPNDSNKTPELLEAQLQELWSDGTGFWNWVASTDSKSLAKRYIITCILMLVAGGVNALIMRTQLARPDGTIVGPDKYNQLFSVHGTTMMFLFAVPVMTAMGLYFVPLMIGARTVPFPRLNNFGYWCFFTACVLLWVSMLVNAAPDAGWFAYVPLSGPQFSPGKRIDIYAQTVTFTEIAALVAATQIIVATFRMRAPGMSLNRIPLFVWAQLVMSFMIVFAMPAVALGSLMLAMDRSVTTHFFNAAEGGDPLLWQHLFWFFGHPEVYIIFIPALGMITPIIETFCRRKVVGYTAMVVSMVGTGFVAFALWVHHMFATPGHQMGMSFFTVASMLVSIPTGVQIFCWIATIWTGRPVLRTPMLFMLGFFVTFVIGGVTGVMVASVPFDRQAHDTYFVVAHLHYVLIGGAVMPLLGAFYYWYPKVMGRMLNEKMGKLNFWLFFIGVNTTFFPMHQLGLDGMTRRIYTYPESAGWGTLNLISTIGAYMIAASVALFAVNAVISWRRGEVAGDNPWDAPGLEWSMPSPPPEYTFRYIPVVHSRSPLWEPGPEPRIVTGMHTDRREKLITSLLDAKPLYRQGSPNKSLWPAGMAVCMAVLFIGSIFSPFAVLGGFGLAVIAGAGWARVRPSDEHPDLVERGDGTLEVWNAQ
jgi:cytochrome c oxidase subunit I+III